MAFSRSRCAVYVEGIARQKELIELPSRSSPRDHNSNYASRPGFTPIFCGTFAEGSRCEGTYFQFPELLHCDGV